MKIQMIFAVLAVLIMIGFFATIVIQNIDARKDPTYASAKYFIDNDETNKHSYDEDIYDCHHFSIDVRYNASLVDIKCAYVLLTFEGVALGENHAIISFDTTDKGMIFFEPQTDEEVDCMVGGYYVLPTGSFKIIDIQYFWEV